MPSSDQKYQTPARTNVRKERKARLSDQGILSTPCRSTPSLVTPFSRKKQCPHVAAADDDVFMDRTIFYLIRHGQSLGQKVDRQRRRTDENLLDCGLSKLGVEQAKAVDLPESIELVVSSPLLRAVVTACLATKDNKRPILIHYHLREIGSLIPENIPRAPRAVMHDLQNQYFIEDVDEIDWDSLKPEGWPRRHDESPKMIRRDRISDALFWLAKNRPEREIAVFCHFHVIQAAVGVHAENARIIPCEMCHDTGEVRLLPPQIDESNQTELATK